MGQAITMINFVRNIKNSAISELAKKFVNNFIRDYGKMVNLKIDSKNKNIELEVLLKGEKENIIVKIEEYKVDSDNGENVIKFKNITASREWVEVLINNMVIPNIAPKRMFKIDSIYSDIIKLLI